MNILPINKSEQEVIHLVDATPDDEYPLRILKAYRQNCDLFWSDSAQEISETNPLIKALNDAQRQRAEILDRAIEILTEANNK